MPSVLVVDDEPDHRELFAHALARDGHELRLADSARDAIDVGCRFRPEVLVADWVLRDHLHGLQVIEAIAAVVPGVSALLVTGFGSADLRAAAARARVQRLLPKPCDPDELRAAVSDAARTGPHGPHAARLALAALESDAAGHVLHRNAAAARLLAERAPEPDAERVADLLGCVGEPWLAAARGWLAVTPRDGAAGFAVRSHEPRVGRSQLWLLRREGERPSPALVEAVLGVEERALPYWSCDGRVLIVDDDELHRQVGVALLESAGAVALAAASDSEALRLLADDAGISVLVVDHEMPGIDLRRFLLHARALRPRLCVVGNSAFERADAFAALGVARFLRKPWRADELLAALRRG